MPCHNKKYRAALRGAGAALTLLLVAACGSGGGMKSQVKGAQRPVGPVEAALCEGRAADAWAFLSAEPLASPVDRFFTALAMEKSGMAISARKTYANLMQSGAQDRVFLQCGMDVWANGTVADEAARHLVMIAQDLRAMDVAAAPAQQLQAGLPSMHDTATSSIAPAAGGGNYMMASTVTRPSSTSPLGRWFAHLSSYKTYQSALANKETLEKQFPALAGYIDQWEVEVRGGYVRLGVRMDSKDDANRLCRQIKSNGTYCAVLDTAP